MQKKITNKKNIIFFFIMMLFFLLPNLALASNLTDQVTGQLQAGAKQAGYEGASDPRIAAAQMVQIFLVFTGSIFLLLVVIAGFWYITARGEQAKIEKATSTIRASIIGLIIITMAYSITVFVSSRLEAAATGTPASAEDLRRRIPSWWP
jgi:cytochrome bd-type quinol oxidase subunit 2